MNSDAWLKAHRGHALREFRRECMIAFSRYQKESRMLWREHLDRCSHGWWCIKSLEVYRFEMDLARQQYELERGLAYERFKDAVVYDFVAVESVNHSRGVV